MSNEMYFIIAGYLLSFAIIFPAFKKTGLSLILLLLFLIIYMYYYRVVKEYNKIHLMIFCNNNYR